MMYKFQLSLVLLEVMVIIAIASPCSVNKIGTKNSVWQNIDQQLRIKLPNNPDAEANMAQLLRWLDKRSIHYLPTFFARNKQTVRALSKLKELKEAVDDASCGPNSYYTRRHLNSATQELAQQDGPIERLASVILHYSLKLASICQRQHAQFFTRFMDIEERFPRGNIIFLKYVRPFFSRLIYWRVANKEQLDKSGDNLGDNYASYLSWARSPGVLVKIHKEFIFNAPWTDNFHSDDFRIAYEAIESMIRKEEGRVIELLRLAVVDRLGDNQEVTKEAVIGQFFTEYVTKSCRNFRKYFGSNSLDLAQEDVAYLGNQILTDDSEDVANYYFTWASYRCCLRLINSKNAESDLRQGIEREARKDPAQKGWSSNAPYSFQSPSKLKMDK